MHAKVYSATTIGIDAHLVEIEVDLSMGMIKTEIVGLPNKAIEESKERIRAALKNSGIKLPPRLTTVNLAPASLKKKDVLFDVPIAVALLQASQLLNMTHTFITETMFLGELALDGSIRPVQGALSVTHGALQTGKRRIILPKDNVHEASLIKGIEVVGVSSLCELVSFLRTEQDIRPTPCSFDQLHLNLQETSLNFSQVKGQEQAKRALQIAAAGRHNILFIGPPGSGKTMLAKRLGTILPPMSFDEIIETTKIYSVSGLLEKQSLMVHRPFRAPHHTISQAGLVGGGSIARPGEISLAHNGILFLDELTEFNRSTLEVLREPLENNKVLISRASYSVEYPSKFLLVAALNPCPCGFYGDRKRACVCNEKQIARYLGKLSGPLLDRIDLHVAVSSVNYDEIKSCTPEEKTSKNMLIEVEKAVALQEQRLGSIRNAHMTTTHLEQFCKLTGTAEKTLQLAFDRLGLSMRGYHKVLKIARTIADLEGSSIIDQPHIREALLYRSLDQKLDFVVS